MFYFFLTMPYPNYRRIFFKNQETLLACLRHNRVDELRYTPIDLDKDSEEEISRKKAQLNDIRNVIDGDANRMRVYFTREERKRPLQYAIRRYDVDGKDKELPPDYVQSQYVGSVVIASDTLQGVESIGSHSAMFMNSHESGVFDRENATSATEELYGGFSYYNYDVRKKFVGLEDSVSAKDISAVEGKQIKLLVVTAFDKQLALQGIAVYFPEDPNNLINTELLFKQEEIEKLQETREVESDSIPPDCFEESLAKDTHNIPMRDELANLMKSYPFPHTGANLFKEHADFCLGVHDNGKEVKVAAINLLELTPLILLKSFEKNYSSILSILRLTDNLSEESKDLLEAIRIARLGPEANVNNLKTSLDKLIADDQTGLAQSVMNAVNAHEPCEKINSTFLDLKQLKSFQSAYLYTLGAAGLSRSRKSIAKFLVEIQGLTPLSSPQEIEKLVRKLNVFASKKGSRSAIVAKGILNNNDHATISAAYREVSTVRKGINFISSIFRHKGKHYINKKLTKSPEQSIHSPSDLLSPDSSPLRNLRTTDSQKI